MARHICCAKEFLYVMVLHLGGTRRLLDASAKQINSGIQELPS